MGDVHRFPSLRRMNAYLGLVPRCHDSGGKSGPGHITGESRKLSRTILTQSIYQTIKATPQWDGEQFHWLKEELYRRKLIEYQKTLEERKKERDAV